MVMSEIILLGVVSWAVGMVTYLIVKNGRSTQQTLDALLVLTDKQAAIAAAGISRARQTNGAVTPKDKARTEREKSRIQTDKMLDEITTSGVMTEQQENFLKEHNAL